MNRTTIFPALLILITLACNLLTPQSAPAPAAETQASAAAPTVTPEPPPVDLPEALFYAIFSINVQDFSYPAESAAVLDKIITLHEAYAMPVDIYLTDVMASIYAEEYPALMERLTTSAVVAISYHYRAPRPYATSYDWLALKGMPEEQIYETILRYETQAVDPVTGQTTDAPGGYQQVAALIGYPPYAASASASDPAIKETAMRVFRELGAQMTISHGIEPPNLGDTKYGLPLRPEHADYKLFEHVGEDAAQAFEAALDQARNARGGEAPYFIGVKMHDNDFFAERSAWLTVYVDGGKRPDWDPTLKAALLTQAQQDAVWSLYEQTVQYVASQAERVSAVNLPMVLEMLQQ